MHIAVIYDTKLKQNEKLKHNERLCDHNNCMSYRPQYIYYVSMNSLNIHVVFNIIIMTFSVII